MNLPMLEKDGGLEGYVSQGGGSTNRDIFPQGGEINGIFAIFIICSLMIVALKEHSKRKSLIKSKTSRMILKVAFHLKP